MEAVSCKLLNVLRDQLLTEDSTTKQTDARLKELKSRLRHSRLRYLKQKALHHFLQQQSTQNSLLRQMLSLKTAYDHIHLLGVEERFVKAHRTSCEGTWRGSVDDVIGNIEKAARDECSKLSSWVIKSPSDFTEKQLKSVPSLIQERVTMAEIKQRELQQIKSEISQKNVELHKIISGNCHQLLALLSDYQLRHVLQDTQTKLDHLASKTDALNLKMNVMKLQLMADTYSTEKNKALREIKSHLDSYQQQLERELVQTEQTLQHYESLGPSFMTLANEYHKLKEDIENRKWALEELGKTQNNK